MARKSDDPITVYGGEKKSAMAVPSRRNSGHMATATSGPECWKAASSMAVMSSTVPGGTVLRITTAWNALAGIEELSGCMRSSSTR